MTVPVSETKPDTARVPLYEQSSQYRHWRFSKEGLDKIRSDLNVGAIQRVKDKIEEDRTTTNATSNETSGGLTSTPPPPLPAEIQYLTVSDELNLIAFYLTKLYQLCRQGLRLPDTVGATAMTYLKRFYLCNTCMDYHPKNIMLTCLFLATKSENCGITISTFLARIPNTKPEDVFGLEFLVSQSLKFHYKVHHPHLAGKGIFLDLQTISDPLPNDRLEQLHKSASSFIQSARLTDAEFLYTPSQIALAAFLSSPDEDHRTAVETWLRAKVPPGSGSFSFDHLVKEAAEIQQLVEEQGKVVQVEVAREVDRRLKYCGNPEKDPNSALFRKRKEEQEREAQAKRAKKLANSASFADEDIFS